MKRFHVHLHVADLARSIGFYAKLFGADPVRVEADYAKWLLDDPAVNFAISTRGAQPGIDHVGIQTDDPAELAAMKARAEAADLALLDEGATSCCYARSEKHWVTDPQGLAWEHFHTLGDIPVFREAAPGGRTAVACCAPASPSRTAAAPADVGTGACSAPADAAANACCAPADAGANTHTEAGAGACGAAAGRPAGATAAPPSCCG